MNAADFLLFTVLEYVIEKQNVNAMNYVWN